MAKKPKSNEEKQNTVIEQLPEQAHEQVKQKKATTLIRLCVPVLALAFAVIGISFSWFNYNKEANVDEFNVTTIKVNNALVSTDGEDWKDSIIFNENNPDFAFHPVAGDGVNFFRQIQEGAWQTTESGKEVYVPTPGYEPMTVDKESEVLTCLDFRIKSTGNLSLYLDPESNISPYNNEVMKDYVAGAMRVAMYSMDENGGNLKLLFIWVPNTTYEATSTDKVKIDSVNKNSNNIETIQLKGADGAIKEYNTSKAASGFEVIDEGAEDVQGDETYLFWGDLKDIDVAKNTPFIKTEDGKVHHFRIVVWFEATDRECESYFAGGKIKTEIWFKAQSSDGSDAESTTGTTTEPTEGGETE